MLLRARVLVDLGLELGELGLAHTARAACQAGRGGRGRPGVPARRFLRRFAVRRGRRVRNERQGECWLTAAANPYIRRVRTQRDRESTAGLYRAFKHRSGGGTWRRSRPTSLAPCGRSRSPSATGIEEGDTVVILESMKMEMPVEAEDEGTVKEILVAEGQAVSEGDGLVVLEIALGSLTVDHPGGRRRPDHVLQSGQAQRAGPGRSSRAGRRRSAGLDARCIVLTGAGTVFSAGYDIGDLAPERLAEEAAELLTHPFEAALAALDAVEVPVVAALGGHASAAALELALACDLRVGRRGRAVRDAAGPARRGLFAHRPARLRRRDRGGAHARAVPHRAAGGPQSRRWAGGS